MKLRLPSGPARSTIFRQFALGLLFTASLGVLRAQLQYPSTLTNEMDHSVIDGSAKEVVVLIHGWTGKSSVPDGYSRYVDADELYYLVNILKNALAGSDKKLVAYHWERDASTGIVEWNLDHPVPAIALGNATQAAINAKDHGAHLGAQLHQLAGNLRFVHFVAHSAGAWCAREAAKVLLETNPYVVVQITLLDPFIPEDVAPGPDLALFSREAMQEPLGWPSSDRIYRLENYCAVDTPTLDGEIGWNPFAATWPTLGTQPVFYWRGTPRDLNQRVDWGNVIGAPYSRYYDYHSGPIEFYADTVAASIGQQVPVGLVGGVASGNVPFEFTQLGWYRSGLTEAYLLPRISGEPQSNEVFSGSSVSLTVTAVSSKPMTYQWFKDDLPIAANGSSLSFAASPSTVGTYVVRVTNENGMVFSDKANVIIAAPTLNVSSVWPPALVGLPLPQTQLLRIYGSGFTSNSRLTFNDGVNPPYTGKIPVFVGNNELDYGIAVGSNAGNWSVQVVNGSQISNQGHFSVVAAPPPSVGSISVTLLPEGAVSAGAQWRVDNGTYRNSGDVVTGLSPGTHVISCKSIGGYSAPSSHSVTVAGGSVTTSTETYPLVAATTYTLSLVANNTQGFIVASPAPTNGSYPAGTVVKLSASANYGYQFTTWSGDILGNANPTSISMDRNRKVTANFIAGDPRLGTMRVTIQPEAAATAGITWGLNENDYRGSGTSYTTFPAEYILTLHSVDGWLGSPNVVATVTAGQVTNVTAVFTPDTTPGLITTTLTPAPAAAAGARWHLDGGPAQSNGATMSLLPGSYTISFDPVPGWATPSNQTVQVQRSQTKVVTGEYALASAQPGIVSVQPNVGVLGGGTPMVIEGMNFVSPAIVTIGANAATDVSVVSSSRITCTTPAGTAYGSAPITVQTAGGRATNANGFAYGLPRGTGLALAGSVGGLFNAVAAQGNYCYAGEGSTFTVLDVSNPAAPSPVGRVALPGLIQDIALFTADSHLYAAVADDDAGLQIVDLANFSAPTLCGYWASGDRTYGVAVSGTYACVGDGSAGFKVLDLSDPASPLLVGAAKPSSSFANRVCLGTVNNRRLAYLVNNGGLQIVDVTDFTNPTLRGYTAQLLQNWYVPNSIAVSGGRAFLADGNTSLKAVDVSNADSPVALGDFSGDAPSAVSIANGQLFSWGVGGLQVYNLPGGIAQRIGFVYVNGQRPGRAMTISGGRALCAGGEGGVYVYDVSSATSPNYRGAYGATAGFYNYVAISGNYAWITSQNGGLKTFNISNPAAPILVSQFRASYNSGSGGEGVKVVGNRAYYLASGQINVLDVSNPAAPSFLGATSQNTFFVQDFYVVGTYILACGADTTGGPWLSTVAVFNAANPAAMTIQSKQALSTQGGLAVAIAGNGSIACVALPTTGSSSSLVVVDVSVPGALRQLGQLADIGAASQRTLRLTPNGRYLCVGGNNPGNQNWKLVDLANASAPVLRSTTSVSAPITSFDFVNDTAFVATWSSMLVYDVSDPSGPQLRRSYGYPTSSTENDVKISGSCLYGTSGASGLAVLALLDSDPPVVAVSSPAPTSTSTSGILSINGTAVDGAGLVHGSVSQVSWSNSRGGGGTATGTSDWSVTGITLQSGTNVLTVTAVDGAGNRGTATVTVTYNEPHLDQTIIFPAIADHVFGDAPIPLVAAASSGGDVVFSVTSGSATISGNLLTLHSAGAVTVRAIQPGNDSFNAASPVDRTFDVARANQAIAFAVPDNCPANTAPFKLTAASNSGLPIYFNIVSGPAVVSGNEVTVLAAGSVVVNAWQPGNSNYNAAKSVQRSFEVTGIPQTVSFGELSRQRMGDAPFALSATSTSGLPVIFSVLKGPATISGNIISVTGAGPVTVRATQGGSSLYEAASVDQTFLVAEVLAITTQPISRVANAGDTVTLVMGAVGAPPISYQWRKDDIALDGATSASLTLAAVQAKDAGRYTVVVSDGWNASITSNVAVLTVNYGFDVWRASKFTAEELANSDISGPNAIYSADGLPNLVKYALGLEPKQSTATGLPVVTAAASDWIFSYTRPSGVTDLSYDVEISTDMASWTTEGVTHELVATAGENQTWRGRFPTNAASTIFFRLKVTRH